jgi:hypothetical protein
MEDAYSLESNGPQLDVSNEAHNNLAEQTQPDKSIALPQKSWFKDPAQSGFPSDNELLNQLFAYKDNQPTAGIENKFVLANAENRNAEQVKPAPLKEGDNTIKGGVKVEWDPEKKELHIPLSKPRGLLDQHDYHELLIRNAKLGFDREGNLIAEGEITYRKQFSNFPLPPESRAITTPFKGQLLIKDGQAHTYESGNHRTSYKAPVSKLR